MISLFRKRRYGLAIFGLALAVSGGIQANEVHISGSTLGAFNSQAFAANNSLFGLTYDNSTFDNTTVTNLLDLGGSPLVGGNFNNLGSFSLSTDNQDYSGNTFQLFVNFTTPTTIVGGATTTFTDRLLGSVLGTTGGVFIDFDNTPQTFTYSNAGASGSFTMFVNDVSIAPGQASSLTGHITGSEQPVPEPSILIVLACGGIGLIRRKLKGASI